MNRYLKVLRVVTLRFAVGVLSIVLALVFIEAGLRVAASYVGPRILDSSLEDNEHVILAIGDSNVYGWKCSSEDAYPGQLQSLLESNMPGQYRVINLGLPGMNSTEAAYRFGDWVKRYNPKTVIVTVGVNNGWIRGTSPLKQGWAGRLQELRIHRLYRILRTSLDSHSELEKGKRRPELLRTEKIGGFVVEQRDATTGELLLRHQGNPLRKKPYSLESGLEILRNDLASIQMQASQNNIDLVLMTYAGFQVNGIESQLAEVTTQTNDEIRRFARDHEIKLVDLHNRFLQLLQPSVPRSRFFLNDMESHPNPDGYTEIVAQIVEDLKF